MSGESPTNSAMLVASDTQVTSSETAAEPVSKKEEISMEESINGESLPNNSKEIATSAAAADSSEPVSINNRENADMVPQGKSASAQGKDTGMDVVDMKTDYTASTANGPNEPATDSPVSPQKTKGRRKSLGVPEHKGKKLNKKASKAKLTHIDAKPGDYYYIRLKGYPLWPGIVCSEDMLPLTLLKSRPVTAAGPDGLYRDDYADGGPKAKDRTFPVMYLHTNEFSWIPNYDLVDLDIENVGNTEGQKMKKELRLAHELAAENNDLEYFKDILKQFAETREALHQEKEAAKAEKARKAAAKKEKSAKTVIDDDEGDDMEMADSDGVVPTTEKKKSNKRKPETPAGDSAAKKIKILFTPKANGALTPKSTKDSKSASKAKVRKTAKAEAPVVVVPKEPELSPEEKRLKKEKEILFLRHKLQKGLLSKEQIPKEDDMKSMAEFITKLEGYSDLEVSIIRTTKINKVLKAIIKLPSIPKEEEYQFKPRSQILLDQWNQLLASSEASAPVVNDVTGDANPEAEDDKIDLNARTNGDSNVEATVERNTNELANKVAANVDIEVNEAANEVKTPAERLAKKPVSEPTTIEPAA